MARSGTRSNLMEPLRAHTHAGEAHYNGSRATPCQDSHALSKEEKRAALRVQQAAALGALSVHEVYPLEVFKRLSGLGGWAMREALREGLVVVKVGRRQYVSGRAFANYLEAKADKESPAGSL